MIEINFLQHEVKSKNNMPGFSQGYIRYLILGAIGLLVCIHLFLGLMGIFNYFRLGALDSKWKKLLPQRKVVDDVNAQRASLSADVQTTQQLTSQRINFSEKLNRLSLDLPSGIWFTDLVFTSNDFNLRGSVISLQKGELSLINKFIVNLKKDKGFFSGFDSLELGTVQRRIVGGYEVVDFLLTGKFK